MFENEKIVEDKICKNCNIYFNITEKDLEFYEKVSPIFEGKKYSIPSPTLCPDCRQQRRLSFRNERKLYKRKCDFSGKDIISIYSPDKLYKIYHQDIWFSDKWNALDYGVDFDFKKNFFTQFKNLFGTVPLFSLFITISENCEYNNALIGGKNCYFTSGSYDENCVYSQYTNNSETCIDGYLLIKCNNCYQCIDCENCSNCFYSRNCVDSHNCTSCTSCKGCENCFGCSNINNKKYYINNVKYSKDEYEEKIKSIDFIGFISPKFVPSSIIEQSENVVGNYISNSKNCFYVFDVSFSEDLKFCSWFNQAKSCQDCYSWGKKAEICYECAGVGGGMAYHNITCFWVQNSSDAFYSAFCFDCKNIFGCVGLQNKQYCIFNKQYTKEDYEKLVPKIIEKMQETLEWGEFFPSLLSPFGYNETIANEYFPIESPVFPQSQPFPPREKGVEQELISSFPLKGGGLRGSFNRSFYEPPFPKVEKIIPAEKLPKNIDDIPDDILNWAIECEITKKPFRIIKQELEFYRKHNLPIPRKHPDQRHLERMALRNPRKLFDRNCDKCSKNIKTTYSPDRKEIVFCESCYEKEVY